MDRRCVFHHEHRQSKGVCPSCLREKLSMISSSSSATSSMSDYDSSTGSPTYGNGRSGRNQVKVKIVSGEQLKKSRSVASILNMELEVDDTRKKGESSKGGGRGGGFWFGFLGLKKKNKNNKKEMTGKDHGGSSLFLHSSTVKEKRRYQPTWVI